MPATRQAAGGRKGRGAGYCLDMTKSSFSLIEFFSLLNPVLAIKVFFRVFKSWKSSKKTHPRENASNA